MTFYFQLWVSLWLWAWTLLADGPLDCLSLFLWQVDFILCMEFFSPLFIPALPINTALISSPLHRCYNLLRRNSHDTKCYTVTPPWKLHSTAEAEWRCSRVGTKKLVIHLNSMTYIFWAHAQCSVTDLKWKHSCIWLCVYVQNMQSSIYKFEGVNLCLLAKLNWFWFLGFLSFFLFFRASGTVFTAIDVATGQEVMDLEVAELLK